MIIRRHQTKLRFLPCLFLIAISSAVADGQDRGATSPQRLLDRLAEGIEKRDVPQLLTCFPAQNGAEEKVAATASAKFLLPRSEVMSFGEAARKKYGENYREAIGRPAYFLMLAIAAMDYGLLAENEKIEIDEDNNAAVAKHGEGLGAMELTLIRVNNRWFVQPVLGLNPDGKSRAELTYDAGKEFLSACKRAVETAADKSEFSAQITEAVTDYQAALAEITTEDELGAGGNRD